jgi:hypothetical protein
MTTDAYRTDRVDPQRASSQVVEDLRALNARFARHLVTNDVAGHEALLHPGFTAVAGSGERLDRAEYLRRWATGFSAEAVPYWDTRDEHVTVAGDVALVRWTNRFILVTDGLATERFATCTATYVLGGGRWTCLHTQVTTVLPPHQPGAESIVSVYVHGVERSPLALDGLSP